MPPGRSATVGGSSPPAARPGQPGSPPAASRSTSPCPRTSWGLEPAPQPTAEVFLTRPPTHIRANLTQHDQGRALLDPFNGRQSDAGHVMQPLPGVAGHLVIPAAADAPRRL